jgi:hypothetical protein
MGGKPAVSSLTAYVSDAAKDLTLITGAVMANPKDSDYQRVRDKCIEDHDQHPGSTWDADDWPLPVQTP